MWGLNFLLSSVVVFVVYDAGIRTGLDLFGISFSRPVELFLIGSTTARGVLTIGAIFAWFWFVYEYTTRPRRRDDILIIGLGTGIATIATLNGLVSALTAFGYIQLPSLFRSSFVEFASLLEILGTGIVIGVGVAQLLRTARTHPPFENGAAVALTVPVLLPYLLRYIYQFGLVPEFRNIQALRFVALSIGLCGLILATTWYQLFDQLPAAQVLGRKRSFETTSTAIVVLDDDNVIADLNAAARSLFGVSGESTIGKDIDTILPAGVSTADIIATGACTFEFPEGSTVVEADTTVTTDEHGRDFGSVIAFEDITQERLRRQRIQVLNRVLRHNLRNNLLVANSYINMLAEDGEQSAQAINKAKQALDGLVDMGVKAGHIEDVLDAEIEVSSERTLAAVVEMSLEQAAKNCEIHRVTTTLDSTAATTANPFILQSIITELVVNAVEHTDEGEITVSLTDDGTGVVVSDSGPGIPDDEVEVFASGEETPLQHGRGLGLWLVKWGVSRLGASFDLQSDSSGTTATVRLPSKLILTSSHS